MPAKKIGIKEKADMAAPNTENTFPRSSLGVFSCRTVCEGTKIETIAMPNKNEPTTNTVDKEGWVIKDNGLGRCLKY